ncbi:hypothetical protein SESBI_21327 [Sesbania bispinosa]|nr:hypothetical protein SESBI_21327 [Sesbania bispinosa]
MGTRDCAMVATAHGDGSWFERVFVGGAGLWIGDQGKWLGLLNVKDSVRFIVDRFMGFSRVESGLIFACKREYGGLGLGLVAWVAEGGFRMVVGWRWDLLDVRFWDLLEMGLGPTVGDVDGDGHTELVVPTLSGKIYVLDGRDGSSIGRYPYITHGRVMNQVLLVDLSKHKEKKKGLTIVTTSFDGYLYLIDGPTGCADVVDIGETSYSMVLADNVDGGDDLDLIVSTMNGNAWRLPNQGRNNVAYRHGREGIYITHPSRAFRDEEGKSFWVEIEIVDNYRYPSGHQGPYYVTTTLLVPGNYQGERTIKQNQTYNQPGKYRIKLPTVGVRTTGTVLVEMVDRNGLYFSDDFSLTFHMHYYKLLKWLLVLPMLGMFGVLVILRPQGSMPLPSFSRNTD